MKAKEITITNIEKFGYRVGKSVKGKGIELFKADELVIGLWANPSSDESIEQAKEAISKYKPEQLYVKNIWLYIGDEKKHFQFEDAKISQKRFSVKELIGSGLKGVTEINIYATFSERVGYFPVSKYSASIEDQKEMLEDLLKFKGYLLYGDELLLDEPYPEYLDDMMTFARYADGDQWNGDYHLMHGDDVCQDTGDCEYLNGRMSHVHNIVLDDFWQNIDELKDYLDEIDPKDEICVYARKGKDWYIGYEYNQEEVSVLYLNEDGEESEETFWEYTYQENPELIEKILSALKDEKRNLEVRSYLYNELRISDGYGNDWSYNDDIFNLKIIDKEFNEDRFEAEREIGNYIQWDNSADAKILVADAYESWLKSHLENEVLFGKYRHFKMLREIAEAEGKKLVYTQIGNFTDEKAYAINFKGEEYHFTLGELFNKAPQKFYREISKKLSKRLLEKYEQTLLIQKAKRVFVGLEDSYKAGNCKTGTSSWVEKHHINTNKIGGIRGDVILEMDFSNFTKRTVLEALTKHRRVAREKKSYL